MGIPEVLYSSIENEQINDISLSDNGNTPEQRVYTKTTPQGKKRKKVKTKKINYTCNRKHIAKKFKRQEKVSTSTRKPKNQKKPKKPKKPKKNPKKNKKPKKKK